MRIIIKLTFIFLLIKALILNRFLIKKYGYKAGEFYSDMEDVRNKNLKLLDYSMIAISLASFVAEALGRSMILSNDYYIFIIWTVFSVSLYFMGLLGFRQKPINPLFEGNETGAQSITEIDSSSILKDKDYIRIRIVEEFNNNKLYLNSELSIIELAEAVGTNRSYVSSAINQNYSQNFCTFVNSFRITELERVFVENPEFTTEKMAEICGFGSVNSMKRAVTVKTGLSFSDFRRKIQNM